ncbi:MAG TPA: group II intron reverse transcriptase/maturase [Polyangia bacterium]|jgi:RNA-directed DNA polymerase|nr:group II intron reverse transcriptase/maturase [Polyangia bacterium]
MSLQTPEKIRNFQKKLYLKAKAEPDYRFYLLYDKVWRADILEHAYRLARANGGAAGVDGVTFAAIESTGLQEWLSGTGKMLRERTYRPEAVRRVMIPKPNGGERPLGIPTIRDRVVQTAVKLVIEPIFEVDLEPNAYGYRPRRSAGDAIKAVHDLLRSGHTDVVDADLSKYFDTIPHDQLMQSVARRVADGDILKLIKMWLKAPVEETDGNGKKRMTGGKRSKLGTPQGGVISPLLANLYMNRFLKYWRLTEQGRKLKAYVVAYADDFVILSRGHAEEAKTWARAVMTRLGLTLNEAKTSLRKACEERFNFLGYSFGPHYFPKNGRRYLGASPSKKSVARLKPRISAILHQGNKAPWDEVRAELNRVLKGWANYFHYGTCTPAYCAIDHHVATRVRHFLVRRHKVPSLGTGRFSDEIIFGRLGVVRLRKLTRTPPPWALR